MAARIGGCHPLVQGVHGAGDYGSRCSVTITSPLTLAKSRGLWVTSGQPWARAVAAIQASSGAIGCAARSARIWPQCRQMSYEVGTMR